MTHENTSLLPANGFVERKPLIRRLTFAGYHILRSGPERLWSAISSSVRVGRNVSQRLLHRSDYTRWANLENYEVWWDARTERIARLVPDGSRVIEFGAGRRQLEKQLGSTCTYVPSDLEDRGTGTFVCDLNRRPLPDLRKLNVETAVFGGVLEYLHELDHVVGWLAEQLSHCVASYTCVPRGQGIVRRIQTRLGRHYFGYMNSYSEDEFVNLFERAGFVCTVRETWTSQRLFLFVNRVRADRGAPPCTSPSDVE